MFWNKKEVVEVDGLPITLSLRTNYIMEKKDFWHEKVMCERFLAYKTGDTWNGVVGYEEYKKKTDLLEAKLDLILDHLKLKYVPETETKEPAKLVEKTVEYIPFSTRLKNGDIVQVPNGFGGLPFAYSGGDWEITPPPKPKKKRGRPKKK